MSEPVVRVSQGFFEPSLFPDVKAKLLEEKTSLDPALRTLRGLLHYYVSIDETSGSMTNVSVWEGLPSAKQMER